MYAYREDLLALSGARQDGPVAAHPSLQRVSSPLSSHLDHWRRALAYHPDGTFTRYVLDGLQHGFRIGCTAGKPLSTAPRKLHSAKLHPEVIDDYISSEVEAGRMLGPFHPEQITGLHVNLDAISPELCSLRYISVDTVAAMAQRLGRGALLAKLDIRCAYRLIPVNPHDFFFSTQKRI